LLALGFRVLNDLVIVLRCVIIDLSAKRLVQALRRENEISDLRNQWC
jgi:hypothetical protein